ncbi:uracil-DNA glycosylase [Candidatus Microgenomates bacterium]|nr:uracil-DNA glycosylase [Candidatus Microgenomates bacterium]
MSTSLVLKIIADEIAACKICRDAGWGRQVFGEGNPNATVMFVGEAPGRQEALSGRPFIGPSGKLLRKMIPQIGLTEEEVYITSPVKYFPNHRTPTAGDILHSKTHFAKQVVAINPKIIVLLGRTAAEALLPQKVLVMKDHGKMFEETDRKYFLTIHPAAVVRFRKNLPIFVEDFHRLKNIIADLG